MLTKLDLMDKGTDALDVCFCLLFPSAFWPYYGPFNSQHSFLSLRFLKEELTGYSTHGLELLTAHKQISTRMLT